MDLASSVLHVFAWFEIERGKLAVKRRATDAMLRTKIVTVRS
jgi:hypothetical protein